MRRWLFLVGASFAVGLLSWWAWPAASVDPIVDAPDTEPRFEAVDVRATGEQQGLTLTGVVRSPDGAPIADAEVFLAASSQSSVTGVRCGVCNEWLLSCHAHETARTVSGLLERRVGELKAALTTRSDAEGKFRFEQLAGTSFTVWGRAAGFGDGIKERAAPGDPVELFLPVPRTMAGLVRDEAGLAVGGATVRVTSRRLARVLEATTDAQGGFQLDGLGEGPFAVVANAEGKLPAFEANAEAGATPITLTLMAARRLEVRTVFQGEPIDAVVALQGDHLTRQLVAKNGFLAVDALYPGELMVSATQKDLSSVPTVVTLSGAVTQVTLVLDRGGRVAVTVLDEAEQPVVAPTLQLFTRGDELIKSQAAQTGELVVLGPLAVGEYRLRVTATGYTPVAVPVSVTPGETPLEVTMTRGTIISGRVVDEYGRPAGGVSVLVTPTGDSIVADAEGRFTAPVPSPGLYELHAHHSDWGGGDVKVTAPAEDVVLQLEPKAGAQITVSAKGRRVEGASVTLYHSKGNFRSDRTSGADGVVLMRGLPPDSYTLVATHPDFLPSDRQTVELRDGDLLKLETELKPGSKIVGEVVDTQGAPVGNVQVTVMPRGAEPATTDGQGKFTVSPLRPGVTYVLRVQAKGYEQEGRVTARPDLEPVKIVVKRQPVFRGRVLGAGTPLKNFRVDEHEVASPDGRFELPLPATSDRVIVTVEAPGYEPMMADRPNTPDLGDFDLERAPQVTGVVRDERGPVPDAVVTCDSCEQSVLSGADGRFSLGKPAFQREFNVVAKKGRRTATRTVTDGALQGLELTLKPGVKLSGLAYLPNGAPAAGVEIAGVNTDRGETVSVVTNGDGSYAMDVSPGVYRFMLALSPAQAGAEDPPALIAEVSGTEARLDFGPVPGLGRLDVLIAPEPGYALWLVKGDVRTVANPPMELLRSPWAQLVYQPFTQRVTLGGLTPGRYTLIWASFHATMQSAPRVLPVDVPSTGEVKLF